jgi:hypothetical protein
MLAVVGIDYFRHVNFCVFVVVFVFVRQLSEETNCACISIGTDSNRIAAAKEHRSATKHHCVVCHIHIELCQQVIIAFFKNFSPLDSKFCLLLLSKYRYDRELVLACLNLHVSEILLVDLVQLLSVNEHQLLPQHQQQQQQQQLIYCNDTLRRQMEDYHLAKSMRKLLQFRATQPQQSLMRPLILCFVDLLFTRLQQQHELHRAASIAVLTMLVDLNTQVMRDFVACVERLKIF